MLAYIIIGIILVILAVLVLGTIGIYNSLINLRNRVKNAWSQIDVQLNRRADLIPNLVETVKGYAKHEKTVFENVTKARASLMSAQTVKENAEANNMLTDTLKSLFVVAENYPELKANQNFLDLQKKLEEIESKISMYRQFYNDTVMLYNRLIITFPKNIPAGIFGFRELPYFQVDEADRKAPQVKF